ncbi:MAG TPA: zinc ribbon domain-containing protein [Gemmatimonadaceae bacterium]|nr:zinc ribbon domain-containing protein [Gemmatimonadaceae bacterium]
MSDKVLFAIAGAIIFALACGAIVAAGRSLRGRAKGRPAAGRPSGAVTSDAANAQVLGEILRRRGLATEAQLAGMSPREVQMLYDMLTAKLPPTARTPASPSAETAVVAMNRPVQGRTVPIGRLFCPNCGTTLDSGLDRPRFAISCPGCGARVSAQLLGVRLTITVEDARGRPSAPSRPGGEALPPPG